MILLEALAADNKNAGEVEEGDKEFQTYADKALSYVMAALGDSPEIRKNLKKEKGQKVKVYRLRCGKGFSRSGADQADLAAA